MVAKADRENHQFLVGELVAGVDGASPVGPAATHNAMSAGPKEAVKCRVVRPSPQDYLIFAQHKPRLTAEWWAQTMPSLDCSMTWQQFVDSGVRDIEYNLAVWAGLVAFA